jgi:ATP-dependent protease ClpP protease subunit
MSAALRPVYGSARPDYLVTIFGPITPQSGAVTLREIERAERNNEGVELRLDTEGGDIVTADAIEDALRTTEQGVFAYVGRKCLSAAVGPLLTACFRQCRPDAQFLLHAATMTLPRTADAVTLRAMARTLERDDARHARLLAAHLRLPARYLQAATSGSGLWLSAQDAQVVGLIHKVVW